MTKQCETVVDKVLYVKFLSPKLSQSVLFHLEVMHFKSLKTFSLLIKSISEAQKVSVYLYCEHAITTEIAMQTY